MSRPSDRQRGAPNRTKVVFDAQRTKRTVGIATARRLNPTIVGDARMAIQRAITPLFTMAPAPVNPLDQVGTKAWHALYPWAVGATVQYAIAAITGGADPVTALSSAAVDRAFRAANTQTGSHFNDAQIAVAVKMVSAMLGEKGRQIAMLPAVVLMIQEARAARRRTGQGASGELEQALSELDRSDQADADPDEQQRRNLDRMMQRQRHFARQKTSDQPVAPATEPAERHRPRTLKATLPSPADRHIIADMRRRGIQAEGEGETGWDVAARRLRGGAVAVARPSPVKVPPEAVNASQVRQRIRAAAAPAFAAALDTAANPDLIIAMARKNPGGADLAKLRADYTAAAVRHFAAEFVRTISSAPKGTSENLALGAIIASSLAQTARQFPIVQPAAVPAMSVLIHKSLQPRLPALARMAAAIAVAPTIAATRAASAGATREMAW